MIRKAVAYILGKSAGAERVRYIFVGGLTTFVNFALFILMERAFGVDAVISTVTSTSASILFAYAANKLIVFRQRSGTASALVFEFVKFIGSRLLTLLLDAVIVYAFDRLLAHALGQNAALLGKVVANVLVIIVNYITSKLIVFRSKPQ